MLHRPPHHDKHRKKVKSEAQEEIERRISRISRGMKYLINPMSEFMKKWDLVMIICLIFTAAATPYEVCFLDSKLDALFIINRIVDLLFLWDMGVQFFLTFENMEAEIVTDHYLIAVRYLRSWFLVDLISIFPFDILAITMQSDDAGQLKMLRIVRLFRLAKLLRVIRASRILQRWESQLGVSFAFLYLIKAVIGLFSVAHWGACLWHLASQMATDEYSGDSAICNNITPCTWVDSLTEQEKASNGLRYSYALWYSFAILFSGEGPIEGVTTTERMTTIAMTIVFGSLYAYVIGSVCGIVSSMDLATKMFQQSMDHLNLYLEENNFPFDMRVKLRTFFNRAKQLHRSKFYHDTLSLMSPDLRREMARHVHAVWMEHISFLKSIPEKEKGAFLVAVAMELKSEVYGSQEKIITEGEFCSKMYIVQKGLVARLGRVLGKGRYVGEDMILHSSRRHYHVITLTFVDIQSLAQKDLEQIMEHGDFPLTRKIIRRSAINLCLQRYIVQAAKRIENMHAKGIEIGFEDIGTMNESSSLPSGEEALVSITGSPIRPKHSGPRAEQRQENDPLYQNLNDEMSIMQNNLASLTQQIEQSRSKQDKLDAQTVAISGLIMKLLDTRESRIRLQPRSSSMPTSAELLDVIN